MADPKSCPLPSPVRDQRACVRPADHVRLSERRKHPHDQVAGRTRHFHDRQVQHNDCDLHVSQHRNRRIYVARVTSEAIQLCDHKLVAFVEFADQLGKRWAVSARRQTADDHPVSLVPKSNVNASRRCFVAASIFTARSSVRPDSASNAKWTDAECPARATR